MRRTATNGASSDHGGGTGALSAQLTRWINEEFAGRVLVGGNPNRPRLHVDGSRADLGWDVGRGHLGVWVRTLQARDQRLLHERLSDRESLRRRKNDWAFDVFNDADGHALMELIRHHVLARRVERN